MAKGNYVPKPGSGSLFRNTEKKSENSPDYSGKILLLDGTECWISAWVKERQRGKFFSLSLQSKDGQSKAQPAARPATGGGSQDDDVPF